MKKVITIFFIVMGIVTVVFSITYFFVDSISINKRLQEAISPLGVAISLLGLSITYYQILSIKEISNKIEKEVSKTKYEINNILSFSEIAHTIELINSIQEDVIRFKDDKKGLEITLFKMKILRTHLIHIHQNPIFNNLLDKKRLRNILKS